MFTRPYHSVLSVIFLILLFSINAAHADKKRTVKVGYIEFPPFFSTNKQGKAVGSIVSLTRKVLNHAGYQAHFQSFPTKRMIKNLVDGKIDLWVGLATIPLFSGSTLTGESVVMSISLESFSVGKSERIKVKQDLNNKSILILRGYSYGGWIHYIKDAKNKVNFIEVDNHEKALKLLARGRADFLLDYKGPVTRALKNIKIKGLHSQQISSLPSHFVVSKAIANPEQLLQAIEASYLSLKKQGL